MHNIKIKSTEELKMKSYETKCSLILEQIDEINDYIGNFKNFLNKIYNIIIILIRKIFTSNKIII